MITTLSARMDLDADRLADKDTVTSDLGKLMFATPGHIGAATRGRDHHAACQQH